ncbi:MAG: prepilin-type N-terminal cleavage/methylation domain-containing protein [Micropepsaceae bacterium]
MTAPRAFGKCAGYSLLELLVVIAIMSMITMIAVPYASGTLEKFSLAADARLVASALRVMRDRATSMQRDIVVTVPAGGTSRIVSSDGEAIRLSYGTTASIYSAKGTAVVTISWDGSLSGSVVLSRAGKSARIGVSQLNGPLKVEAVR